MDPCKSMKLNTTATKRPPPRVTRPSIRPSRPNTTPRTSPVRPSIWMDSRVPLQRTTVGTRWLSLKIMSRGIPPRKHGFSPVRPTPASSPPISGSKVTNRTPCPRGSRRISSTVVDSSTWEPRRPRLASGSSMTVTFRLVVRITIFSNAEWHNVTYTYNGEGSDKKLYLDGRLVGTAANEDTFGEYPPFNMSTYSQYGYTVSASTRCISNYRSTTPAFTLGNSF